jgi:hypothetical protein
MKKKSVPARKLQLDTTTIKSLDPDLLIDVNGAMMRSVNWTCPCTIKSLIGMAC